MRYLNIFAAISCTFIGTSLGMCMEDLTKEHCSNLKEIAMQFPLYSSTPNIRLNSDECIGNAMQFVERAIKKNGSLPSPVSLEYLKTLSVPEQLLTFTKLFHFLHCKIDEIHFYDRALIMATQLMAEKSEFQKLGFIYLIENYYLANNFDRGYDCLNLLILSPLYLLEKVEIERITGSIFIKSPKVIEHFDKLIGDNKLKNTKDDHDRLINCFLNALCHLKTIPTLDDMTLYSIASKYLRANIEMMMSIFSHNPEGEKIKQKYLAQAIFYYVWSAKAGNAEALNQLITMLSVIKSPPNRPYYDCLIPILRTGDQQAQDLFNTICYASEGTLSWFSKYKAKQEEQNLYPEELKMVNRVMDNFDLYRAQKQYQAVLCKWDDEPKVAINLLEKLEYSKSKEAVEKLKETRALPGYKNPKEAPKNDHGRILKERDTTTAQETYRAYKKTIADARKDYISLNIVGKAHDDALYFLYRAAKLGDPQAMKEENRVKKSKGYQAAQQKQELVKSAPVSFDDYFGRQYSGFKGLNDMLFENNERGASKKVDEVDYFAGEHAIQGTYSETDNASSTHHASAQTMSITTTTSTTTAVTSTRKKGKGKQVQELHPSSSITTKTTTPVEKKEASLKLDTQESVVRENHSTTPVLAKEVKGDPISASLPQESEVFLTSGEGSNIPSMPFVEHKKDNDLPKANNLRSADSENMEPNTDEKAPKKVRKTLERTSSLNSLKTESKRKELRRTVTVMSLPASSAFAQEKSATDKGKVKDKKSLSKKSFLSNLTSPKDKSSKKNVKTPNEKDLAEPLEKSKSKRSSSASIDCSASESESELKKTPRKHSKKSSSSSLSSSMEGSHKTKNLEDTLISLKMLPELSGDYNHYHNSRLCKILINKYDLAAHKATLEVILGKRKNPFEVSNDQIKQLLVKFDETVGSHHHGSHEIIKGLGITLNPNANDIKVGSYYGQLDEIKDKIINIIALNLTYADYKAAHKDAKNG